MQFVLAFSLTLALLAQGGSCRETSADNVAGGRIQTVQPGAWGGEHVRADVSGDGVSFEFDCAHGAADGPPALAADGNFDLKGFFAPERGGPARAGQKEQRLPARYAGRVEGETMTLSVTLTESGENIGTYTLTRGRAARLNKCL